MEKGKIVRHLEPANNQPVSSFIGTPCVRQHADVFLIDSLTATPPACRNSVALHQAQVCYWSELYLQPGVVLFAHIPVCDMVIKQDDYVADPTFRQEYPSKVGALNFAPNQTRPDIAFATGYGCQVRLKPRSVAHGCSQSHLRIS